MAAHGAPPPKPPIFRKVIVPSGRGTVSVRSCRDWASLLDGRMTIDTELTGVTVKGRVLPGTAPDGWPSLPRLARAHLPRTPAGAISAASPGRVRPIPAPLRLRRPALSRGDAAVPARRDHPAHRRDFEALTSGGYHDLGQPCERHRHTPSHILRHIMFRPNLVRGRVAAHVRGQSAPWFKRSHEAPTINDDQTDGLRDGRCFRVISCTALSNLLSGKEGYRVPGLVRRFGWPRVGTRFRIGETVWSPGRLEM